MRTREKNNAVLIRKTLNSLAKSLWALLYHVSNCPCGCSVSMQPSISLLDIFYGVYISFALCYLKCRDYFRSYLYLQISFQLQLAAFTKFLLALRQRFILDNMYKCNVYLGNYHIFMLHKSKTELCINNFIFFSNCTMIPLNQPVGQEIGF